MRKFCLQALLVLAFASASGRAEELTEFASQAGRFKVLLPGKPDVQELPTPAGTMHLVQVRTKAGEFLASWIDLPANLVDSPEKIETSLNKARDGILERLKGKQVHDKKITLDDKHSGRDFGAEISSPDKGRLRARMFLVEGRLYQVIVVGTSDWTGSKVADRVLESFRLAK
jgi:hypothetical protein